MTKLGLLTIYDTEVLTLSSAGHLFIHSFQHIFTKDYYAPETTMLGTKTCYSVLRAATLGRGPEIGIFAYHFKSKKEKKHRV